MKKLFIFDSNPGEVGKSRCVKAIFHVLNHRMMKGEIEMDYKVLKGSDKFENKQDLKVLIEYRGVKIGLESQGDPGSRLVNSVEEFVKMHEREIIICACRTRGKDARTIKRLCKKEDYVFMQAPHMVVKNQDESLYDRIAENYANGVIAAIDKWIDLYK